jgi:aldehyde:ferredoxin oxidoreductase
MKLAGFDQILVRGRSERPVLLVVEDGAVRFRDATPFWGLDAVETHRAVQDALGDRDASVLTVGLAGENEVRFASVLADCAFIVAGGFGALFGQKRLKAVAFRATGALRPAHPDLLREKAKDVRRSFARAKGITALKTGGTLYSIGELTHLVPARNFTNHDHRVGLWGVDYARDHFAGPVGCFSCPVHCGRYTAGEELSSRGIHFGGLEIEGLLALSSRVGIHRWFDALRVYHSCVRGGLDPLAFGSLAAWLTDGYARGLLDTRRTGRIMAWDDVEQLLSLASTVARREGPGRFFGEGVYREARRMGGGAERILAHALGVDWPAVDPRLHRGTALAFATEPTDWNSARMLTALDPGRDGCMEVESDLAAKLARARILSCLAEMAGLCPLPFAVEQGLDAADVAELLFAVTGEEFTKDELRARAAAVLGLEMEGRVRDGLTADRFRPSDRFFAEAVPDGARAGAILIDGDFTADRGAYFEEIRRLRNAGEGSVQGG